MLVIMCKMNFAETSFVVTQTVLVQGLGNIVDCMIYDKIYDWFQVTVAILLDKFVNASLQVSDPSFRQIQLIIRVHITFSISIGLSA